MKIKVCGITNLDDALFCEASGADALGFIFYKKSKRYILPESVKEIINALSPFTMKVGVFVNESIQEINKISSEIKLSAVQLHGEETPAELDEIFLPVIKSFRVGNDFDFSKIREYKNNYLLLDALSETEYGGTGQSFDWNLIPLDMRSKVILAGGVSIENIEKIFNGVKPSAVDLSSSLESEPGKKDRKKVIEFFNKLDYLKKNSK